MTTPAANQLTQEVIITDPTTGGKKGIKLAQFGLIPPDALTALSNDVAGSFGKIPLDGLWALAELYGRGARKYSRNNFLKGYAWSLSYDALCRHLVAFMAGEDTIPPVSGEGQEDPTTGACHLSAVAWHFVCLWVFQSRGLGTDDRCLPKTLVYPEDHYDADSESWKELGGRVFAAANNYWGGQDPINLLAGLFDVLVLYSKWHTGTGEDDRQKTGV